MSGSGSTNRAYLILGIDGVGKTTFGRQRARAEGGVCLSFSDFFYKILGPDKPTKYSYSESRVKSAGRWFCLELKKLCEEGVNPIYVDQPHSLDRQTINTAGLLELRYEYEVKLVEPDTPFWNTIRPLLNDKDTNREELIHWAHEIADFNPHLVTFEKVILAMDSWRQFTVDELLDAY